MELSRNFSLQELIKSDTAIRLDINNNPNSGQIEKLKDFLPDENPQGQSALPLMPMPNVQPLAQQIDPRTNLTRTETALLSPEEQVIASRT